MRERNGGFMGIGLLLVSLLLIPQPGFGLTFSFEDLSDLESVTTQFDANGVSFSNTIALTSGSVGGNLNELEFPPKSGLNVISDDGGPMTLTFAVPFEAVGGFFTYAVQITLEAFDPAGNSLMLMTSAFSENVFSSGNLPNEFIQIAGMGSIGSLRITGDALGASFTLDDFQGTPVSAVPEPTTLFLLVTGLAGLWGYCLLKRSWLIPCQ